ncbi:hypothetical protein C7212DRAFT_344594 [Tuber magnatum]|uniref:Uncharacterized protein n=1 Tax=Tuber magnatum TaxID=42249 RepID=A0A317SNU7_9PEZI|nr:hypothetical protein C7212DRAFT_344594 [Tuber magnatum]
MSTQTPHLEMVDENPDTTMGDSISSEKRISFASEDDSTPKAPSMTRSSSTGSQRGRRPLPFHRGTKLPDLFKVTKGTKLFPPRFPDPPGPHYLPTATKEELDNLAMRIGRAMAHNDRQIAEDMEDLRHRIVEDEEVLKSEVGSWQLKIYEFETAVRNARTAFEQRVAVELERQQTRQARHEEVSTYLHTSIGASEQQSLARDQSLEVELGKLQADRDELASRLVQQEETIARNGRVHREFEKRREAEIVELKAQLANLMTRLDGQEAPRQPKGNPSVVELPDPTFKESPKD